MFEASKIVKIANHMPKSLLIDDSDRSEDLCIKITWIRVVKSRISVNSSSSSRVTENLQITEYDEWFRKFTFHGK